MEIWQRVFFMLFITGISLFLAIAGEISGSPVITLLAFITYIVVSVSLYKEMKRFMELLHKDKD